MNVRLSLPSLPFVLVVTVLGLPLPAAAQEGPAGQGTLTIRRVQGRAEVQMDDRTWRPQMTGQVGEVVTGAMVTGQRAGAGASQRVERGLRTGAGRVTLVNRSGGRTLVGSASQLRPFNGEADLQSGQFLLQGPAAAYARGCHLMVAAGGKVRVDLTPDGSTQRVAVVVGQVRVSSVRRLVTLSAGQQLTLTTFQQTPFVEEDPWYAAVFTGAGQATVEATHGTVRWWPSLATGATGPGGAAATVAHVGLALRESHSLSTAANSWAEVGFTGGGYLRLSENSELKVLAVEKTARGREVNLQLVRGSAWNVVARGQGGYRISTPVVSTAVRGTTFRVDASGLVKVVEGSVALPSEGAAAVSAGQQKPARQPAQALQKDALDRFNEGLDAARADPLTLHWGTFPRHQAALAFTLSGSTQAVVTASVRKDFMRGEAEAALPLPVEANSETGTYRLKGITLPDGRYTLHVKATRFGQTWVWSRAVWVDRTPPQLSNVQRQVRGRIVTVTGLAQDAGGRPLTLHLQGPAAGITRTVPAGRAFQILLPATWASGPLHLKLRDAAGNGADADLH